MFPLLQQSGVANRWQRSDLKVTRRRRLRPFAPSLLSAVPSNGPTEPDGAPANPGLGKHHTQAYPRTKSGTDAVTFRQLRNSNRIEPVSRKLKVASRQWAKRIGQGGLRDALQTNGEHRMRLVLYAALSKRGEILAQRLPAILRICQAIRAPLDELQPWIRGAGAILR